jgi:two-component system response regulator DctR
MGALQFVDALKTNQFALPTVLMMETLIASEVVAAMRSGVVNCVELPLTQRALCEVISDAFTLVPNVRKIHEARRYHELYHRLKETEKEIVGMAAIGVPNKQIASRMQLSVKTVEKYRRQAYATLGVNNTAAMTRAITLHSMHNLFDRCRIQFPERSLLATAEIGES